MNDALCPQFVDFVFKINRSVGKFQCLIAGYPTISASDLPSNVVRTI
ncbi:hypothetical protein [Commensalibacter oyaizuii]|uniref:Uncharacterized protein n=1 Tax=Commensalibacter oyaizuii TaxID=3043873 RepID=A0ABT6Q1V8_9PROT|nr:hypothetical protein [Commensalibacter sp. TBRC 16381]MDI2091080.1 hypothetical protein [Commensalibacter sp. TBRC 16381]